MRGEALICRPPPLSTIGFYTLIKDDLNVFSLLEITYMFIKDADQSGTHVGNYSFHKVIVRSKTERGSEGPGMVLSAGAHTLFLLEREDLSMSLLQCPDKIFRQGN